MTWKEYIEARKWYRGTKASENPKKRRGKTTFWLPDKKEAREYADPERFLYKHPGQVITAEIKPEKVFVGSEPVLAERLGLAKRYNEIVDRGGKYSVEIDKLVADGARKAGIDVQAIARDQLQVFNPKALRIVKTERIKIPKNHPRIFRAGGYASRGGTKLSRSHRKGFKKVRFA
jgi:hypothetical protein